MKRQKNLYKHMIFLLIIFMGIGFAVISRYMYFWLDGSVKNNRFDVHFENVVLADESISRIVPIINDSKDTITFSAVLRIPGDYYEFRVDTVNAGTLDARLSLLTKSEVDEDYAENIQYTVTYTDGTEVKEGDIITANKALTYVVRIEYLEELSADDYEVSEIALDFSLSAEFEMSSNQGSNYNPLEKSIVERIDGERISFIDSVSSTALSDSSINFASNSSSSNGKGLYVRNGTESDNYPIYYYRGQVSNNHAKFLGYCWRIVRTTEKGGIKLIYNGMPDSYGSCYSTGSRTQLSNTSVFNNSSNSPAGNGYMYGTVYNYSTNSSVSSYIFGKTFSYSGSTYTLTTTQTGYNSTHHYTCLSSSTTCSTLYYVYYINGSTAYYITLTGGKSVENALDAMQTNTNSSSIKNTVDNWFSNNIASYFSERFIDYNDYIEDSIYCNDRSKNVLGSYTTSGWIPNGGGTSSYLYFGSYGRIQNGSPVLNCQNKNDAFTVNDTENGNGALTYPVGLITADEINLAGITSSGNSNNYLYTGNSYWIMSPIYFSLQYPYVGNVNSSGGYSSTYVNNYLGVRPVITLNSTVKMVSGRDGTTSSPYEFVLN